MVNGRGRPERNCDIEPGGNMPGHRRAGIRRAGGILVPLLALLVLAVLRHPTLIASPGGGESHVAMSSQTAAAITLGESRGPVGRGITVTGRGFASGEVVDLRWNSSSASPLASPRASSSGTFSASVTIPDATFGPHPLYATGRTVTKGASATYTVTPSLSRVPSEGAPWTRITVTARGFGADEDVRLTWLTETGTVLGTIRTNRAGTGTVTITMPNGKPGWNDYTGYGLTSRARAWGALKLLSSVSLSPTAAAPGATVDAIARGYPPGESATVTWNTTPGNAGTTLCRGTIASNGTLVCRFAVPRAGAGVYPVTVTSGGGTKLSANLTVTGPASVTISPTNSAVGTNVTITAGGFAANETVVIDWDTGAYPRSVKASPQGAVSIRGTVPRLSTGQHTVRARGASSGRSDTAPFSVSSTPAAGSTSRISEGVYSVYATREGLVGGTTSSGHKIVVNDYFVSLPACTSTNCPGGPYWGNMTNCGTRCYVKVINPRTNACRVEPILDTGPWFRVDDWWNPTASRYLNTLSSNPNTLTQGYTGADAARNGLDVGYGVGPNGIGRDDTGTSAGRVWREVGNRSAIDLADGTWYGLGITSDGTGAQVTVQMLWQTGADPATQARACGHPLNERPNDDEVNPPGTANPSFAGQQLAPVGSGGSPGSTGPWNVHDGRWSSAWSVGSTPSSAYLTIDYGRVHQLSGVKWGFNATGYADRFTVQTSVDRVSWSTLGTFGNAPRYAWYGAASSRQARYVRFVFANPNADTTIGYLAEVQAWGAAVTVTNPPGTANPAFTGQQLTPVSSSGTSNGSGSRNVHDNVWSSSWYTVSNPNSSQFTLDYGQVYAASGVRWGFNRDGASDQFIVEISADGARWTTIGTFGNAPRYTWHGRGIGRQVRYLRVTFANRNGDATVGYMAEIQLWGSTTTTTVSAARAMPAPATVEIAATPSGQEVPVATPNTAPPVDGHSGATPNADLPSPTADAPGGPPSTPVSTVPTATALPPTSTSVPTATSVPSPMATSMPVPTATNVPSPTPSPTPTPAEPDAPTPTPTLTPVIPTEPTASEAPSVQTAPGYVAFTDGGGANCRTAPDSEAPVIGLLPEGTQVDVIGLPESGWQRVRCEGREGYVFADFLSDTSPPAPTETVDQDGVDATSEPNEATDLTPVRNDEPAEDTPPTALPTEVREPEPEPVVRELVVPVATDTGVSRTEPDSVTLAGGEAAIPIGGGDGDVAVLTFQIEGIGEGTVIEARLVVTGAGDSAGGGQLLVVDGAWFDDGSTSWNDVAGAREGPTVGGVEPGAGTAIDVSGYVTADGTVTFLIIGEPGAGTSIVSGEGGAPAHLVIAVEEWVVPGPE